MCSDSEMIMSDYADQNHAPSLTCVRLESEAIKKSIPDLVTLSVSMPQHLMDCEQAVREIKQEFPGVKVAVGGKAFESTNIAKFAVIT